MSVHRWRISLRRRGRVDTHYAQTLKVKRSPTVGDQVIVRDIDGSRITAIVRTFERRTRPKSRFEIYAVNVDELDRLER
jgi:hypothetical protein